VLGDDTVDYMTFLHDFEEQRAPDGVSVDGAGLQDEDEVSRGLGDRG
jgi:hypothetical protein